jgi:nucleoside-diphosphate-sugar epimerase
VRSDKRVLVTGAGGFIGRCSVPALLRSGFEVHAALSANASRDVPEQPRRDDPKQLARDAPDELRGARLHHVDLLQETAAAQLMGEVQPSHLLHFAWIATPGLYWHSAENFRWLAASEHLLRCFRAHGGRRVLMAGSCAEYDWSRVEVCDELLSPLANDTAAGGNQVPAGLSPYAACKIALQSSLADFGRRERLSTAWGRIFFQFGPHEHPDRLVPSVIGNLLSNREAPCSHGRQVRSFLHVADVGAAFAAVLASELEGPVNIGSDERISLADLVGRIARQIGRPELLRLGARPAAPQEPPILVPDIRRLRGEAGWQPSFSLDAALSDTIAWWRGRLLGSMNTPGRS